MGLEVVVCSQRRCHPPQRGGGRLWSVWLLFSCCSFKMYQFIMLFGFAGPCFISFQVLPRPFRFCCFHCCSFCLTFTGDYLLEGSNSKFNLGSKQYPVWSLFPCFKQSCYGWESALLRTCCLMFRLQGFIWTELCSKDLKKINNLTKTQATAIMLQSIGHSSFYLAQVQEYMTQVKQLSSFSCKFFQSRCTF